MMQMMSDKDAARFVAALDKVDVALLAIRMEFEEQVRISAERLAAIKAQEAMRVSKQNPQECARTPTPNNATPGDHRLTASS